jgi:hypothetical protein
MPSLASSLKSLPFSLSRAIVDEIASEWVYSRSSSSYIWLTSMDEEDTSKIDGGLLMRVITSVFKFGE